MTEPTNPSDNFTVIFDEKAHDLIDRLILKYTLLKGDHDQYIRVGSKLARELIILDLNSSRPYMDELLINNALNYLSQIP